MVNWSLERSKCRGKCGEEIGGLGNETVEELRNEKGECMFRLDKSLTAFSIILADR